MKKIAFCSVLILFTIMFLNTYAVDNKYVITKNPLPSFKIIGIGYISLAGKIELYEKESPLLEYNKGIYTFYEYENHSYSKHFLECKPKFDSKGNPVTYQSSDDKFKSKLYKTLYERNIGRVEGDVDYVSISYLQLFSESIGSHWITKNFNSKGSLHGNSYSSGLKGSISDLPPGSIAYLDNDFNYEVQEYKDKKHTVIRREALNPDLEEYQEIPGLYNMPGRQDSTWHGYYWIKLNSYDCVYNGKKHNCIVPVIHQGRTAIDIRGMAKVLHCGIESSKDGFEIVRIVDYLFSKTEIVKLSIKFGDEYAYVNDEKKFLSFPLYKDEKTTGCMISLRDICDILKAKLHWRSIDNTALIEYFPADE